MLLEARSLARRYTNVEALRGADLHVQGGEVLAVVGASGAGKSTLLRLLHLLEAPDAGEVLLDGAAPAPDGAAWRAAVRRFGLVQQRPGLLRQRAVDNVAFPLRAREVPRAAALASADAWLARLGLAARRDAWPHELSGGEAQRVALARALAPRPDALLFDEATNQLDPASVALVEGVLREERARGCAIVLVTHNLAQVRRIADRVAFLHEGRVAEEGPAPLLDAPATPAFRAFVEAG